MQYNYEMLTPDRFQELCQALVTRSFRDAVSYPVGKRDGGRDILVPDSDAEQIVFQVKFRRTPEAAGNAASLAIAAFDAELPKIRKLQQRGATRYILVTNLSATAGLDTGERDRVEAHLRATSPIPAVVWWREEIDARLNDAYDIKWAFSEIITSADLLRKLLEEGFGESATRRDLAITAYLTAQYADDEFVKFKQADLQASDLLALFIDVPALPQRNAGAKREQETRSLIHGVWAELADSGPRPQRRGRAVRDIAIGAATLLLSPAGQRGLDRAVLEGGPGQGKSTLAQYVCQVHRMKILGKDAKLSILPPQHRLSPVRVPFKVDLRDLANWLRRTDPFKTSAALDSTITPSLESFLAAQIHHLSGGQIFSVDDLRLFLRRVPALIVLDGLDEVAAMSDRRDVIEAVNGASARLSATAASIQLLVTSRPAATASTPRFSGSDWHFLDLQSITEELIFEYTNRWGAARRLDARDVAELRETLSAKLSSPHIMDLARNAMQLTILLQLIHSRGAALPDQRTLLYDKYIDVLFNREADKNPVVRENRQLLIDLHGYVAWRMHGAAQARRANGRISEGELRDMISQYLVNWGYDNAVLDDLFSGVVQRIVALVSRVEGTFEFEVQPLREYFAGRHLYDTAPNSPVGNPQSGTKLEIFDALSKQPYWLNVTRFYAGCYAVGELAGLADQVETLIADPQIGRTSFSRVIATSLLGDRVFQQSPKITMRVVKKTADELSLRYAFGRLLLRGEGPIISVPGDCGRKEFLRMAVDRAIAHSIPAIRFESAMIAQESFSSESILDYWLSLSPDETSPDAVVGRWLAAGNGLGTTMQLEDDIAGNLAKRGGAIWRLLAEGGAPKIVRDPEAQRQLIEQAMDGRGRAVGVSGALGWALISLDARSLGWPQFDPDRETPPWGFSGEPEIADLAIAGLVPALRELVSGDHGARSVREAANRVETIGGRSWLAWVLAIRGFHEEPDAEDLNVGIDPLLSLTDVVSAAASARRRQASPEWWQGMLSSTEDKLSLRALMAMCLLWCTPAVLERNLSLLEERVEKLSCEDYETLVGFLRSMRGPSSRRRISTRKFSEFIVSSNSRRTLVALSMRGTEDSRRKALRDMSMDEATKDRPLAEMALDERMDRIGEGVDIGAALDEVVELLPFVGETLIINFGLRESAMPIDAARRVLLDPDRYPISLVQAADSSTSSSALRAPNVASIARRNSWAAG